MRNMKQNFANRLKLAQLTFLYAFNICADVGCQLPVSKHWKLVKSKQTQKSQ